MKYKLPDLIDIESFQNMQDRLNEIYSFPSAIIDNEGNILTATAWQDVCTQFHRKNQECAEDCVQSDQYILSHLHEANPAVSYRCPRGLVDNATPIIIGGIHYGNFFTGQFFLEKPDLEFFRAQAKRYGFPEAAYLEAVKKVPIWTQKKLNSYLFFIKGLIAIIAESALKNLKEMEARGKSAASEERASAILRQMHEGFWIADTQNGQVVDANEAMCRMIGYTHAELLGMSVADVEANDSPVVIAQRIKLVVETGSTNFESRFRHKDGTILDVEVSISYLPKSNLLFCFHRDITERKRADEALRKSEQAARRLAQESDILAEIGRIISSTLNIEEVYERFAEKVRGLIPFDLITVNTVNIKDLTRTITYVNGDRSSLTRVGESYPIAGTRTEQVVHTRSGLLTNSKNREEIKKKYPGMMSRQSACQSSLLIPLISKDEAFGVLNIQSSKIDAYSDNDLLLAERVGYQIAGAIANAQLFLDRLKAQEEKRSVEERLQRAEKMEALGQLAGGVAHDLNNVLGILSGYSELLLEEVPSGTRSRGYVEKILQSTEKGAAIIQDLLTLARRGVTASEVINLNGVVADFLKTPVFDKLKDYHPRVTFRTEYDPYLLNIKGSAVHLEKTLMNLVSNAAEAISGQGAVTIRTENRYLDKPLRGYDEVKEGDYVVLTVSDTGMGIPAENREKIFEPFYTKKTMGRSGTGLGLSIVWGTVKDHDGYIDVQTEVGQGTTFTVYFPVTREELIVPQQKAPIERYLGNGESVLVVDDIAEQRDIAARLLTRLGYEVHTVASGEQAVEYLRKQQADILVLDMIMAPGIDGLDTYQRVLAINPRQKAILISGFSETDRVRQAQQLGAGAYVKKPYVMEKIGLAIREELK